MSFENTFSEEQALFSLCLEHPESEWEQLLAARCSDPELRGRVRRLLQYHRETPTQDPGFLRLDGSDPDRIGPYRILRRMGEGGMGIVYAAEQREPVRRRVAVKVLRGGYGGREVLARFDVERQALALMNHPNIARILDAGTTVDHRPFIVMEFVPGEPVTRYCEQRDLDLRARLKLFRTVCDAVQHAHQKGVIHRDLKPSNILVMEEDGRAVPKIIDFGIAKALTQRLTEHTLETQVGSLLGTPDYMSPEQAELSPLDVDTRSDVYALGAVLYQLLAGKPPLSLSGRSYTDMQRAISDEVPAPPSQQVDPSRRRQVRGELDWITLKALEKQRIDRYAAASDLAADIRRYLDDETVAAGPPSRLRRMRKFVRRHWFGTAATAIVIVTLAVSQMLLIQKNRQLLAERDRANVAAATSERVTAFLVDIFRASDNINESSGTVTARELLDRGRAELERDASFPITVRLNLFVSLAKAYQSLGFHEIATDINEQAMKIYGENQVDDLSLKLRILSGLASSLQEGRHTQEAKSVIEDASVLLASENIEPAARFKYWRARAEVELELNNLEQARELAEKLFLDAGEYYGKASRQALEAGVFLAYSYWTSAAFNDAEKLINELLPISRRVLGDEHHLTVVLESGMGTLHLYLGHWKEAEQIYSKAYDRLLERLGPDSIRTQEAKLTLAITLPDRQAGLAMLHELEAQQKRQYGDDAPVLIDTLLNIGWIHSRIRGDEDIAKRYYDDALARAERLFGPEHQTTRFVRYDIAALHARSGQSAVALEILREVIDNPVIQFKAAHDPDLAPLRSNPEFIALLGRFGDDEPESR